VDVLLVFRALGVPDQISDDHNRERAAASRLAVLADRPLDLTVIDDAEREVHIRALVRYVAQQTSSGALDGVLGGFESPDTAIDRLARTAPAMEHADAAFLLAPLLAAIVRFVEAHPFADHLGRYFS
jgi:hypothetical protein